MTIGRALTRTTLGGTGLEITALSFGSAPLATVFWGNDEATAIATVRRAEERGIRLFDSAPFYGLGEAESRIGAALSPDAADPVLVTTKAGRTLHETHAGREAVFDFDGEAVERELAASLERLGRTRADIVHIHDPEDHLDAAIDNCFPTLARLQSEGVIGAVSVGTNECSTALRFLRDTDLDAVLLAGRLTLLDDSALDEVVPRCASLGVPLLAAGVFNSGVLADPTPGRWYDYAPADSAVLDRARRMQACCEADGSSLQAAALAYPLRFEPVASVVVGMAKPAEVDENIALLDAVISDDLWAELDSLRPRPGE